MKHVLFVAVLSSLLVVAGVVALAYYTMDTEPPFVPTDTEKAWLSDCFKHSFEDECYAKVEEMRKW